MLRGVGRCSTVFTVTNINDSGLGSLRQAILDSNANSGADTIAFDIPGTGATAIAPLSDLPPIFESVSIDGYSQTGSSANTLTDGDNAVSHPVEGARNSLEAPGA